MLADVLQKTVIEINYTTQIANFSIILKWIVWRFIAGKTEVYRA
jgi:hypothetical protein